MIWALIKGTGTTAKCSELIIIECNPKSKRNGYSAVSYMEALDKGLLLICNSELFMQDNASVHTAHAVRA